MNKVEQQYFEIKALKLENEKLREMVARYTDIAACLDTAESGLATSSVVHELRCRGELT